jgi:hypothetical protein
MVIAEGRWDKMGRLGGDFSLRNVGIVFGVDITEIWIILIIFELFFNIKSVFFTAQMA